MSSPSYALYSTDSPTKDTHIPDIASTMYLCSTHDGGALRSGALEASVHCPAAPRKRFYSRRKAAQLAVVSISESLHN